MSYIQIVSTAQTMDWKDAKYVVLGCRFSICASVKILGAYKLTAVTSAGTTALSAAFKAVLCDNSLLAKVRTSARIVKNKTKHMHSEKRTNQLTRYDWLERASRTTLLDGCLSRPYVTTVTRESAMWLKQNLFLDVCDKRTMVETYNKICILLANLNPTNSKQPNRHTRYPCQTLSRWRLEGVLLETISRFPLPTDTAEMMERLWGVAIQCGSETQSTTLERSCQVPSE